MIIVQLSDLHCADTEQFLNAKLTTAIQEINTLNPDLVIIAGDLAENGFKTELEEAKHFINQIQCRQKIITMGNHDARYTGYMIFEELFGVASGILDTPKCRVLYVNTARPDRDAGHMGRDQIKFIENNIAKDRLNVLVMHHHLIPVPDTGLEAAIAEDAGDVLKMLSKVNPELVLSGHRHRPWSWKLNDINFFFSGAVSTIRLRGFFENSYNVIQVENGKISPRLKIVGGDFIDFNKLTRNQQ